MEDAAERLDVSQATIRRDFDQLAQQQMITRTRGGAVANGVSYDLPLRYKTAKHAAEKQRIGAAAAALVAPGMVVGAQRRHHHHRGGPRAGRPAGAQLDQPDGAQLTVVTNALNIANELLVRSRMKIVVTGGVVRPQSFELVGPLGGGILREVTLDMALLGVDAIDVDARRGRPPRGRGGDEQPDGGPGQAGRHHRRLVQAGQARVRPDLPDRTGRHPGHRRRRDRRHDW